MLNAEKCNLEEHKRDPKQSCCVLRSAKAVRGVEFKHLKKIIDLCNEKYAEKKMAADEKLKKQHNESLRSTEAKLKSAEIGRRVQARN